MSSYKQGLRLNISDNLGAYFFDNKLQYIGNVNKIK